MCGFEGDLGDATVTATGPVGATLTAGSVGVVMSGALANIAVTLDEDLGIGRELVVTATATATDSDGRPAADKTTRLRLLLVRLRSARHTPKD